MTGGRVLAAHALAILSTGLMLVAALGGAGLFGLFFAALAALAVMGSLLVTGLVSAGAYLIGGEGGADVKLPPEWVVLAPVALNSLCFASLVFGGFSHMLLFAASFPLLFLTVKPKFPPASMSTGVVAGFAAFVLVLLLSYLMDLAGAAEVPPAALVGFAPTELPLMQFYGWYMLLVVAVAEEMWRAATYYTLIPPLGARLASALATFWFVWMHLPGRILYGPLAALILLLIGAGTLVMWYLCKGDYWGMVVAHAVYNTAIAGVSEGLLLVELAVLGAFLAALWVERRRPKIEIAAVLPVARGGGGG